MLVIAHPAHWTSLIFFVPVIAFIVWLAVDQLRQRRESLRDAARPRPER